ncbi:trehalase-like domain-containing protein, partial [Micromonospora wenchangensis]
MSPVSSSAGSAAGAAAGAVALYSPGVTWQVRNDGGYETAHAVVD